MTARFYAYLIAVAATLAIVGWAAFQIDRRAYQRGYAASEAIHAKAAAKAQAAIDLRDQRSAEARTSMLDYLAAEKPAIETRTHDTITEIRKVYVDRPLPAVCARPERVQASLDAARERANAAASGLRLGTTGTDTPGAGMAGNRPVGRDHDGALRDSGHTAERDEPLPVWLASVGSH